MSKISRIFTTYRMSKKPFYNIADTQSFPFTVTDAPLAPIQEQNDYQRTEQQIKHWEFHWLNTEHDILATEIATEVAEAALEQ